MLVKYKLTERYLFYSQNDTKYCVATSAVGFCGGKCWDQEDSEVGPVSYLPCLICHIFLISDLHNTQIVPIFDLIHCSE